MICEFCQCEVKKGAFVNTDYHHIHGPNSQKSKQTYYEDKHTGHCMYFCDDDCYTQYCHSNRGEPPVVEDDEVIIIHTINGHYIRHYVIDED